MESLMEGRISSTLLACISKIGLRDLTRIKKILVGHQYGSTSTPSLWSTRMRLHYKILVMDLVSSSKL